MIKKLMDLVNNFIMKQVVGNAPCDCNCENCDNGDCGSCQCEDCKCDNCGCQ